MKKNKPRSRAAHGSARTCDCKEVSGLSAPRSHGRSDQRLLIHAARLLEEEAACMREGHTHQGRWEPLVEQWEIDAKANHDDMLATAKGLRRLADPSVRANGALSNVGEANERTTP